MNHSSDGRMAFDHSDRRRTIWFITVFIIIAATGLTYVKWWPYYDKALKAIMEHSIGSSILGMDPGNAVPSWQAAWDYAVTYFKAVWKAAVLGILLGTLIQSAPSQWRSAFSAKPPSAARRLEELPPFRDDVLLRGTDRDRSA